MQIKNKEQNILDDVLKDKGGLIPDLINMIIDYSSPLVFSNNLQPCWTLFEKTHDLTIKPGSGSERTKTLQFIYDNQSNEEGKENDINILFKKKQEKKKRKINTNSNFPSDLLADKKNENIFKSIDQFIFHLNKTNEFMSKYEDDKYKLTIEEGQKILNFPNFSNNGNTNDDVLFLLLTHQYAKIWETVEIYKIYNFLLQYKKYLKIVCDHWGIDDFIALLQEAIKHQKRIIYN